MGKSGEEFIKFIERQQQEAGDDSTRAFYEDMERQYYEAQEERARMNSDEYKQQKEEIVEKPYGVYSITFTHTLGYDERERLLRCA